jgi:prophage endopeptidase
MDRTSFIIVITVILFLAFALGWFANWVLARFTRVSQADLGELDRMAQALHEAEDMRDQAIAYIQNREVELTRRLQQTQAELEAAVDGLREARRYAETLHQQIHGDGRH